MAVGEASSENLRISEERLDMEKFQEEIEGGLGQIRAYGSVGESPGDGWWGQWGPWSDGGSGRCVQWDGPAGLLKGAPAVCLAPPSCPGHPGQLLPWGQSVLRLHLGPRYSLNTLWILPPLNSAPVLLHGRCPTLVPSIFNI